MVNKKTVGERAFSFPALSLWNCLLDIRQACSVELFKAKDPFVFCCLCIIVCCVLCCYCFYLLYLFFILLHRCLLLPALFYPFLSVLPAFYQLYFILFLICFTCFLSALFCFCFFYVLLLLSVHLFCFTLLWSVKHIDLKALQYIYIYIYTVYKVIIIILDWVTGNCVYCIDIFCDLYHTLFNDISSFCEEKN